MGEVRQAPWAQFREARGAGSATDAPYRPGTAAMLDIDGGQKIRFAQRGIGQDVLLLHGTLLTLEDMMIALGDHLAPRFRITALDRPGHGLSTRLRFSGSLRSQTRAIHDAVKRLGLSRPLVIGHSAGGAVAAAYALDYPDDIAGVLTLAPIVLPELRLEHLFYGARALPLGGDALAYTAGPLVDAATLPLLWHAIFAPQAMPQDYRDRFPFALAGKPGDMQAIGEEANHLIVDLALNLLRYPQADVPTAILGGDSDAVVNPAHGAALSLMLRGSRYRKLAGLGHMLHHFAQGAIIEAIHDLLAADAARRTAPDIGQPSR